MYKNLTIEDYQKILKFITTLNNVDVFETEVLQLLKNLIDFDQGILITLKSDSSISKIYGYQTSCDFIQEYSVKYHNIDPVIDYKNRAASESLADQTRNIDIRIPNSDREYAQYKLFYGKYNIENCMMFSINERGDGIRLYRRNGAAAFTDQDFEVCKFVSSAIGDLYKTHLKYEEIKYNAKLYRIIKSNMYFGVLLFDDAFQLISYNKIGIERLSELTHKQIVSDMTSQLTTILKQMLETEAQSGQNLTIYKIMDNYIIELLINRELDEFGNIVTNYIVFLYGKAWFGSILTMSAEKVIDKYELTEREKQLVSLILQGYSNQQISERLFISTYTVKEHIKSIFRKMNLKSRGELIIKVYSDRGQDSSTLK